MALDSSWAKIHRAKEHLDALRMELADIREPALRSVLTEATVNPGSSSFTVRTIRVPTVPQRLSIIVSDVIHNLRSALDHAAYEVTTHHRDGPFGGSQFPIVGNPKKLSSNSTFHDTLAHFTPKQRAVVEGHQPYDRVRHFETQAGRTLSSTEIIGLFAANDPLGWIRDLSNRDKHRLLIESFVVARNANVVVTSTRDCANMVPTALMFGALKEKAEIAIFHGDFTGPSPQMTVDFTFDPEVIIESDRNPSPFPHSANLALDLMVAKTIQITRELEELL